MENIIMLSHDKINHVFIENLFKISLVLTSLSICNFEILIRIEVEIFICLLMMTILNFI